ncbi:unnamed protein product, partial [Mesorhabditis spiculigera]
MEGVVSSHRCDKCGYETTFLGNMRRHCRRVHGGIMLTTPCRKRVVEKLLNAPTPDANGESSNGGFYCVGCNFELQEITMAAADFVEWQKALEDETNSRFAVRDSGATHKYLRCAQQPLNGDGSPMIKIQPGLVTCPAFIKTTLREQNVEVIFCDAHSHVPDVPKLSLRNSLIEDKIMDFLKTVFWRAYCKVFPGNKTLHLLCKWHVLKSLTRNLNRLKDKSLVKQMKDEFRILLNLTTRDALDAQIAKIQNTLDMKDEKSYRDYFDQYYLPRADECCPHVHALHHYRLIRPTSTASPGPVVALEVEDGPADVLPENRNEVLEKATQQAELGKLKQDIRKTLNNITFAMSQCKDAEKPANLKRLLDDALSTIQPEKSFTGMAPHGEKIVPIRLASASRKMETKRMKTKRQTDQNENEKDC